MKKSGGGIKRRSSTFKNNIVMTIGFECAYLYGASTQVGQLAVKILLLVRIIILVVYGIVTKVKIEVDL